MGGRGSPRYPTFDWVVAPERSIRQMPEGGNTRLILMLVLLGIAVTSGVDLILDAPRRWLSFHAIYELSIALGGLGTATALWVGWMRAERTVAAMSRSLAERAVERDTWRRRAQRAIDGFGRAIDDQFTVWRLTPAERQIALALLQGRSHKEIAAATARSERTVRQHAVVVYQKAGVSGRAELGAFFLESLMLPPDRNGGGDDAP